MIKTKRFTIEDVLAMNPCNYYTENDAERLRELFGKRKTLTLRDVVEMPEVPPEDAVWIAVRMFTNRQRSEFCLRCAIDAGLSAISCRKYSASESASAWASESASAWASESARASASASASTSASAWGASESASASASTSAWASESASAWASESAWGASESASANARERQLLFICECLLEVS